MPQLFTQHISWIHLYFFQSFDLHCSILLHFYCFEIHSMCSLTTCCSFTTRNVFQNCSCNVSWFYNWIIFTLTFVNCPCNCTFSCSSCFHYNFNPTISNNIMHLLAILSHLLKHICYFFILIYCCNPSFGLATKAKGLQGCEPRKNPGVKAKRSQRCEPRRSLGVKAKRSQRCEPRRSLGVTSHTPGSVRKCEGVWGSEPSHSQGNSHFGRWSPGGFLKLQRAISGVKPQWLVAFFYDIESSWNVDV